MIITSIRTPRISVRSYTLEGLLNEVVADIPEGSILAITSKIVSLCEGAAVRVGDVDKQDLVRREADFYLTHNESTYGIHFTVRNATLIHDAGVDESNADDMYVLWPNNPQKTANTIRLYLMKRFERKKVGVIITDSTCRPMRRGVSGIAIAYSGFKPLHDYVGEADVFGRPFKSSQADIVGGLAASAVLNMGEGAELTPLVLLSDMAFVEFVARNPTAAELAATTISLEDDLFAPFLTKVEWVKGGHFH